MSSNTIAVVVPEEKQSGFTLSWNNLTYQVPTKDGQKTILSGLSGIVEPGSVVAVLGASGAGKSSFLDVLAGRKRLGVTGEICINGTSEIPIKVHI